MYLRVPIEDGCRILVYARYSTDEQREESVTDQRDFCVQYLEENGVIDPQVELISDEGMSGELRSRPGIDEVLAGIKARRWDLVMFEDSSRAHRGIAACSELVGTAVDLDIRVICINDQVDTCNEDWQQRLEEAQRHHGQDNYYTRFRIKRALEGLWRMGAAIGLLRPGYRRKKRNPDAEKSPKFDEIIREWVDVIVEAFQKVADGDCLESVADYLTEKGLPKFANSQFSEWNERNVLVLIRCELYRGVEIYREEISRKYHISGKSKPIRNPNPKKILQRDMPHLRIVEDWLWYAANKAIDDRARPTEPVFGRDHPLYGIPRDSRSLLSNIFICDRCGSKMYAEGRNEGGYRCSAARKGECWNKTTCLRDFAHEKICTAVSEALLRTTPGVIDVLVGHIEELLADRGSLQDELRKLARRHTDLEVKQRRLLNVIAGQDQPPEFVTAELVKLDAEQKQLRFNEQHLQSQLSQRVALPSREQILGWFQQSAQTVRLPDQESRPLLRRLIDGQILAVPYQCLGNSNVVLRAEFTLQLVRLLPADVSLMLNGRREALAELEVFRIPLSVDLFEMSKPQQYAVRALEIYRENPVKPPTLEQLGAMLGISKRSAHLALQLGKQMEAAGVTDPFIRLSECPANPSRWRFKEAN